MACWLMLACVPLLAQQRQDELSGLVLDQAGAVIVGAEVSLVDSEGKQWTAKTDKSGVFRIRQLAEGTYRLTVTAPGFGPYVNPTLQLDEHLKQPVTITLTVVITEELNVEETAGVTLEPADNVSAIVLRGEDLDALPDDPDELMDVLRQMAGPTAGAGDAQILVDGFEQQGGLPPKETIREIRINNNPFSAEYSEPGFGRIEILTRPGTESFRGGGYFDFNDESLNARNAFAPSRAPLQIRRFGGAFGGPLVRKRANFLAHVERRETDENAVVRATVLDPVTFAPTPFAANVLTPQRLTRFTLRTEAQVTKNNTLTLAYMLSDNDSENQGVGEFYLPEHAFRTSNRGHELRLSLSSILSGRIVNEARLRLSKQSTLTQAASDAPQIVVLDAFTRGGAQSSLFIQRQTGRSELVDQVSLALGRHAVKMGVRADAVHLEDVNRSDFGGTFTFASLEQYRDVINGVAGAHPEQFSINRGDPFTGLTQWEFSWFIQEDWRVRPNVTLSLGLRHEFQTHLGDKSNFAPRLGFAWSPGGARGTVVRGGFGLFYDQLQENLVLNVLRYSREQRQFIIIHPGYPNPLDGNGESRSRPQTLRIFSPGLNAPYAMQATMNLERQLPLGFVSSLAYSWVRGVHQYRSRNINAPLLDSGALPFPGRGPILAIESVANSTRHELRLNVNRRLSRTFSLFGNYVLSSTRSDGDGAFSLPADPYDLRAEWGRAASDARHQFFIGGFINLPWSFRFAPFVALNSGRPFNITTGRDNNGDTALTDRPALVDPSTPGVIVTRLGAFDPKPAAGTPIIPRNFGQGPGSASVDLYLTKTFGFGGRRQSAGRGGMGRSEGGAHAGDESVRTGPVGPIGMGGAGQGGGFGRGGPGGGRWGGGSEFRYNLTISVRARNLFNRLNPRQFSGVLTSPFFGEANSALAPRRIELELRFSF
ncbi:MAG: TonB-dependent receptor [Acidobacteria bacterium]|nr:TonB-dependent receptor [Acidobacteriota bacterium]